MKQFAISRYLGLVMVLWASACSSGQAENDAGLDADDQDSTSGSDADIDGDADNDADVDTDADTDGDTDTDIDTDSDSDGDIDTDAAPTCDLVLDWVIPEGGDGMDSSHGISVLPDGSIIVAGGFQGRAYLGFDLISEGGADVFVAKYNNDGSLVWAHA